MQLIPERETMMLTETTAPNAKTMRAVSANPGATTQANQLMATKTVRLQNEGLVLRYAELGDPAKPTVILLHGVPENLHAWYAVAPLMAAKYRVLAFDWPGFGGSEPLSATQEYTSRRFAAVVVDFMDSLGIERANLVATDIALLPALLVGLESPDRVERLAVMDGIPFPRPQHSSWELKSFAKKGSIRGTALVRWFPQISSQIAYLKGFYRGHAIPAEVRREFSADGSNTATQDAFLSYFQNFRSGQEYFEARAHELQSEVLVVWGKYDRFISSKLGEEIAHKLPNAGLEVIDRAGHYIHMDKPQALVDVVSKFLEQGLQPTQVTAPKTQGAAPVSKHKTAFLIWLATFPTVLLYSMVLSRLPFDLPQVFSIFIVTALAIPTVVYVALPLLTK